ncbi:MAG: hypothetical protein Q4P65_02820 [Eubacteriales bacterium]|nr:hypothetical protein [Eubacteriales bacterium]
MPASDNPEKKIRPVELTVDELWKKANMASAEQAVSRQRIIKSSDDPAEKIFKAAQDDIDNGDRTTEESNTTEAKDNIREFVNSLYRGAELAAARDKGDLREPRINLEGERRQAEINTAERVVSKREIRQEVTPSSGIRPVKLQLGRYAQEVAEEREHAKFSESVKESRDREQVDAFAKRLPDFKKDGTAEDSEDRRLGSELINQAEYTELEKNLPPDLQSVELEAEPETTASGIRHVQRRQNPTEFEDIADRGGAASPTVDTDLETDVDSHPLLKDQHYIRSLKVEPSPDSENILAREIAKKREAVESDIRAALEARPERIERTVEKLQSGMLSPPFYVPRLPRQSSSFSEAVDFARRLHPLPQEMQMAQQPPQRSWLLAQLNHCNSQERLSRFAFSLNHEDLALLFPTLATLKRGKQIDRLLSIILMRASHYLYLHGWITLQYAYPRSTVEKGLSELCSVLDKSEFGGPELGLLERQYIQHLNFGKEQFIWTKVRKISEIALPNQRHFLSKIISYIQENGLELADFYDEFAVYPDLPLAKALQSSWDMALYKRPSDSSFSPRQLLE